MPNIVCVVPTIRPESHRKFVEQWSELFRRHAVTLITVWDGDEQFLQVGWDAKQPIDRTVPHADLMCRRTDACRNWGFVAAARLNPDYVLTLDDDCYPPPGGCGYPDPIEAHLGALSRRVPLGWMNTAHGGNAPYLRGVPYGVRDEAPVMLSHGVWVGTPDFDGETQLALEQTGGIPSQLPYFDGPVPRATLFPLCGMNVMVRWEALKYLYYAPMGADSGFPDLHRFADIFMGVSLKREFDRQGWACWTGASTVLHSRASDAKKNFEQEKLGRRWMELVFDGRGEWADPECERYWVGYNAKRERYADLVRGILGGK